MNIRGRRSVLSTGTTGSGVPLEKYRLPDAGTATSSRDQYTAAITPASRTGKNGKRLRRA
jgi:hypothetical protein